MKVEIWSDLLCPFCYIGKRKFERALEHFAHREEVEVAWRSFELMPDAPRESARDMHDLLAAKLGGDRARAVAMNRYVTGEAAAVGLRYDLDRAHPTNSFDAHRLIHLAAAHGLQDAAEERLFAAHFTEARHIGRHDTLKELAAEIGLDEREVADVLAGDAYAAEVRAEEAEGRALGLTGVPFFVIDRTYAISGAQPSDLFLEALRRAWAEAHPLTTLHGRPPGEAGDAACADGTCAVPAQQQHPERREGAALQS
jgi:predicted DsbA family dithiol-disulfide isomerase